MLFVESTERLKPWRRNKTVCRKGTGGRNNDESLEKLAQYNEIEGRPTRGRHEGGGLRRRRAVDRGTPPGWQNPQPTTHPKKPRRDPRVAKHVANRPSQKSRGAIPAWQNTPANRPS
ncbi:hypothetical protein APED_21910 [Acanthopleuribacter pedis]